MDACSSWQDDLVQASETDPSAPFAPCTIARLRDLRLDDPRACEVLRFRLKAVGVRVPALDKLIQAPSQPEPDQAAVEGGGDEPAVLPEDPENPLDGLVDRCRRDKSAMSPAAIAALKELKAAEPGQFEEIRDQLKRRAGVRLGFVDEVTDDGGDDRP